MPENPYESPETEGIQRQTEIPPSFRFGLLTAAYLFAFIAAAARHVQDPSLGKAMVLWVLPVLVSVAQNRRTAHWFALKPIMLTAVRALVLFEAGQIVAAIYLNVRLQVLTIANGTLPVIGTVGLLSWAWGLTDRRRLFAWAGCFTYGGYGLTVVAYGGGYSSNWNRAYLILFAFAAIATGWLLGGGDRAEPVRRL